MKKRIQTGEAPKAVGPYSQAIVFENPEKIVFLSGQIGIDPETGKLREGLKEQTEQALKNLMAILKSMCMTSKDVVKTTIFITDMSRFKEVNEIYARFFEEPYPARSTVAVKELPLGALVEIEAIAVR